MKHLPTTYTNLPTLTQPTMNFLALYTRTSATNFPDPSGQLPALKPTTIPWTPHLVATCRMRNTKTPIKLTHGTTSSR